MLFLSALTLTAPDAHAAGDALVAAWGDSLPPTSWLFVLESAGDAHAPALASREPIARLVETLPAGDRVQMLAVHTRTTPLLPARTIAEDARASLAAEIRALEIPSAKSADLGAALVQIDAALDAAEGSGAFVLVYQGALCHSPPLGSTWADGGFGCREIRGFDRLKTAWSTPPTHAPLAVEVFPTGGAANEGGLGALTALVEPAGAIERHGTPLAGWVDTLVQGGLANARVAPLARAELAGFGVTAAVRQAPRSEDPRAVVELSSGLEHLVFEARSIRVEGAHHPGGPLRLGPDATLELVVDIPKGPFSLLPRHDTVDIPVRIVLDGEIAPAAALTSLGLDARPQELTVDVTVKAERTYGLSPLRSAAVALSTLALGAGAALIVSRRLKPVCLGGTFSWRKSGGPRQPLSIEGLSEAPIVVRSDGTLGVGRREDAAFVLIAERPLWKTHVRVEVLLPGVEINTRPANIGRHSLVAGAASFAFRDYRLSWE